jgi:hypothetical protein
VTWPPQQPLATFTRIDPDAEVERLAAERRKVGQEACVLAGGHCYDLTREHPDLLPGPCKHCGARPGRGPTV